VNSAALIIDEANPSASANLPLRQLYNGGDILVTTLTSLVNSVALGFVSLRAVQFLVLDQVVSLELTTGGVLKSLGEDTAHGALSEIPKDRRTLVIGTSFSEKDQKFAGQHLLARGYLFLSSRRKNEAMDADGQEGTEDDYQYPTALQRSIADEVRRIAAIYN